MLGAAFIILRGYPRFSGLALERRRFIAHFFRAKRNVLLYERNILFDFTVVGKN
jgi:hypothetical protein